MKIKDLCTYGAKSSLKAGDAISNGQYTFFTSSSDETKRYSEYQYDGEGIVMGTGGKASLIFKISLIRRKHPMIFGSSL